MRNTTNYSILIYILKNILKIDLVYFIKGGFYSGIQQFIGISSGLVMSYIYGHFVQKSAFGEFNMILSIISIFTFLSLPGIDTALIRSVGQGYEQSFKDALLIKMKYSLRGTIVLIIVASYYLNSKQVSLAAGLFISAVLFPFLHSFTLFTEFLTAKKMFRQLAIICSSSSIMFLAISAFFIFMSSSTVSITLGYLLAILIPAIIGYVYAAQFLKVKSKTDPDLNNYGNFLTNLSILPWISGNIGNVILGHFLGVEALAIFTVANRFLASAQKNLIVFYKPVTAKLAEQSVSLHQQTLRNHFSKFLIIGGILTLMFWLFIPFLIHFLFPTYEEAISHARLLSLALIPMPLTWVLADMSVYQKQKKLQIFTYTLPHILKICLYFILIPAWKINGLIMVVLFDRYFTAFILTAYFFRKAASEKFPNVVVRHFSN